jgi:transposase
VLQFVENLSDRAAADAVRGRLDWKYLLGLELTDPGFHHTVLSEFRSRLVAGQVEQRLLDGLLERLQEQGLLQAGGRQRTDSTHVLAAVRDLNRLERVGETLRAALNSVAVVAPDWLQISRRRCGTSATVTGSRTITCRKRRRAPSLGGHDRGRWAIAVGGCGCHHRARLAREGACGTDPASGLGGAIYRRRGRAGLAPGPRHAHTCRVERLPYDPDARYSTKRRVEWVGYKVHLTETCDPDTPHLIVNVETTPATTPDDNMVAVVHASLAARHRLPAEHLVDKGYTSAQVLLDSQRDYRVAIVGPVADDPSWQARAGEGFAKADFRIDWDRQVVTCPAGHQSGSWLPKPRSPESWWRPVSRVRIARRVRTVPDVPDPKGTAHHRLATPRSV